MGNRGSISYTYPTLYLDIPNIDGKGYIVESYERGILNIRIGPSQTTIRDGSVDVNSLINGHMPGQINVYVGNNLYTWKSRAPARGPLQRGEIHETMFSTPEEPVMQGSMRH